MCFGSNVCLVFIHVPASELPRPLGFASDDSEAPGVGLVPVEPAACPGREGLEVEHWRVAHDLSSGAMCRSFHETQRVGSGEPPGQCRDSRAPSHPRPVPPSLLAAPSLAFVHWWSCQRWASSKPMGPMGGVLGTSGFSQLIRSTGDSLNTQLASEGGGAGGAVLQD